MGKFFATLKKFYENILQGFSGKVNDITCRLPIRNITLFNINATSLDFA